MTKINKLKRIYTLLIAFVLLLELATVGFDQVEAKVYSGKAGKHVTWTYNTKTKTLTFSGKGKMYSINHWFDGSMGDGGDYRDSIWTEKFGNTAQRIVFKKGITNVGGLAFASMDNLKSVKLPSSITQIEKFAFAHCRKLKSVKLPRKLKYIGEYAFCGCNLSKIKIPNSVKKIERSAFSYNKISSFTLPKNMTKIPEEMFYYNNMTKVTIPNNVKTIGDSAFEGCDRLKKITFNKKLKIIDSNAFDSCERLSEIIVPDSTTVIRDAFCYCKSLKYVRISKNVKEIDMFAFLGCSSLEKIDYNTNLMTEFAIWDYENSMTKFKELIIPEGVKCIQQIGLNYVEKIVMPKSVDTLSGKLFEDNVSMKCLQFQGDSIKDIENDTFLNFPSDCVIYVPADCVEKYTTLFRSGGLSEKVAILPLEE